MNIQNKYLLEVWIGLAKVEANDSVNLIQAKASYVNVLGLSRNKNEFRKKINSSLKKIGLKLKSLQDVEPFNERLLHFSVDKSLKDIAKKMITSNDLIEFGTFHTYD